MPRRRQSKRVSTSPYARRGAVLPDSGPVDAVAAPGVGMPEVSMPATDSTTAPPAVVPAMSGDQFAELIAVVQQGIVAGTSQMDLPVVAGGYVAPVESVNTPIGIHVPLSIRQKIVNGEYVDLGSLLATNHSKQSSSIQVVRGRIEVTQKANTVRINTLDQWSDAFIIFISIYITAHPNAVQGLLKYFSNIRLGASRGVDLGWKAYDEQFRLKMAQNPGSDWGTIESELWLLYTYSSPAAPAQSPPAGKLLKCIPFNNTGRSFQERQIHPQTVRSLNDVDGWHLSINRNGGWDALSLFGAVFWGLHTPGEREDGLADVAAAWCPKSVLCRHRLNRWIMTRCLGWHRSINRNGGWDALSLFGAVFWGLHTPGEREDGLADVAPGVLSLSSAATD